MTSSTEDNFTYTRDDQEFFFQKANEILDRFGLLNNIPSRYIVDVILRYSDSIVNDLDEFREWKEYHERRQSQNTQDEPTSLT
jgi:hypothetical protein